LLFFTSSGPVAENIELYSANDVPDFDHLGNYGNWIHDRQFGLVWRPCCIESWRPFYYGHWIFTRFGWTWIGYEPFSWITSHYGTWFRNAEDQWLWISGYEWSPARVQWIQYGDNIGWSPVQITSQPWLKDGRNDWVLVPFQNFTREMIGFYCCPVYQRPQTRTVIRRIPPELDEASGLSHQRIQFVDTNLQTQGGSLKLSLPWTETRKIDRFRHSLWNKVLKPMATQ
jgi:uncharacterized protein DUF6600